METVNEKKYNFKKIDINLVLVAFIGIGIVLAVLYPSYFKPDKLLLFDNSFIEQERESNYISIIVATFKTILMGILINKFIIEYQNKQKSRYIIYSYLTMLMYILLNTGINRLNMIIPLIIFILITDKIFKRKGRLLFCGVLIILTSSITAITVSKFTYKYDSNSEFMYVMTDSLSGIQEYTSNIRPIALGLDAIEQYSTQIGLETFFNDFLGSVPVISHYINQNDRINMYYNRYVLHGINTSQIVPMVVSSIAYFSHIGPTVLTIVIILIIMYLEGKSRRKKYDNFLQMYMSNFLTFQIAFCCLNGNIQMIVGKVIVKYIPVILILWLNNKIKLKNSYKKRSIENENV